MDVLDLIVVLTLFGLAGKMWQALLDYRLKAAGIRAGQPARGSTASKKELEALRQEVDGLRETTTGFDMAFDTALQRLESRLTHLEARMARYEAERQAPAQVLAGRIGE